MVPEVIVYGQVAAITVALAGSLAGVTIFLVNALRPPRPENERALPGQAEAQLAQLQQSIDAIAVEVERIAEAQRFTTRVLADRTRSAGELSAPLSES